MKRFRVTVISLNGEMPSQDLWKRLVRALVNAGCDYDDATMTWGGTPPADVPQEMVEWLP